MKESLIMYGGTYRASTQ